MGGARVRDAGWERTRHVSTVDASKTRETRRGGEGEGAGKRNLAYETGKRIKLRHQCLWLETGGGGGGGGGGANSEEERMKKKKTNEEFSDCLKSVDKRRKGVGWALFEGIRPQKPGPGDQVNGTVSDFLIVEGQDLKEGKEKGGGWIAPCNGWFFLCGAWSATLQVSVPFSSYSVSLELRRNGEIIGKGHSANNTAAAAGSSSSFSVSAVVAHLGSARRGDVYSLFLSTTSNEQLLLLKPPHPHQFPPPQQPLITAISPTGCYFRGRYAALTSRPRPLFTREEEEGINKKCGGGGGFSASCPRAPLRLTDAHFATVSEYSHLDYKPNQDFDFDAKTGIFLAKTSAVYHFVAAFSIFLDGLGAGAGAGAVSVSTILLKNSKVVECEQPVLSTTPLPVPLTNPPISHFISLMPGDTVQLCVSADQDILVANHAGFASYFSAMPAASF